MKISCTEVLKYVYHEIIKEFYWPNIKRQIENVIKRCEIYQNETGKSATKTNLCVLLGHLKKLLYV